MEDSFSEYKKNFGVQFFFMSFPFFLINSNSGQNQEIQTKRN